MANDRKEYQREWRKKNPRVLSERDKALKKEWAEKHAEETRQRNKVRYEAKKKQILDQCKAYQEANKEKISARRKARYQETREESLEARRHFYAENKELFSARAKAAYLRNKETCLKRNVENHRKRKLFIESLTPEEQESIRKKRREYMESYFEKNKEWIRERNRKYDRLRPEVIHEKNVRRRSRKALAVTPEEKAEARALLKSWKAQPFHYCTYCDAEIRGKDCCVDHIIPLARGGRHVASNLCLACRSCNSKKGAKILGESWFPPTTEKS